MTTLRDLVAALDQAGLLRQAPAAWPAIAAVTQDSRQVTTGTLFCAVPGTARDGHAFLEDAVRRGAAAAIVGEARTIPVPTVLVADARKALAVVAAAWHGRPADGLRLIAVTGTNGKSTTVSVTRHLLNSSGTAGSIGTLGAFDGAGAPAGPDVALTTPGALELHAALAALRARGVDTVVMEASSHALHQLRLHGLVFSAAVYTNLTHDHLDYHGDLQSYLAAKLMLSEQMSEQGTDVVNADDPAWEALPQRDGRRRVLFGRSNRAAVRGDDLVLDEQGSAFSIAFGADHRQARLPLLGEFNVSNALGAAAAAWALGISPADIVSRLASAPQVTGRMEQIASGGFVVLRDYAHTPDALDRAIKALRPITRGRLVVLFGCGGDRDRRKRPVMGRIAARGADLAIVTSDNPRTEDPERIVDEIETGMEGVAHLRITDRREAIGRAVAMLEAGDCLLLAGKGHETYQILGTTRVPMDERLIVAEALARRTAA